MKKRIIFAVMLAAAFLLPLGTTPALASGLHGVTGGIHFTAAMFGMEGWMQFNVHATGAGDLAKGWVRWQEYNESDGWRRLVAHPTCVAFGESEEGAPVAVFVVQIDSRKGWGEGEVGQYILFWVLDGGTPGQNGDQFTTITWPPQDAPLACEYNVSDPLFIFAEIDAGNLKIH